VIPLGNVVIVRELKNLSLAYAKEENNSSALDKGQLHFLGQGLDNPSLKVSYTFARQFKWE